VSDVQRAGAAELSSGAEHAEKFSTGVLVGSIERYSL
jgi:hypothetical protein